MMAHYDCSCCGETGGISHDHCPECKVGRCARAPGTQPWAQPFHSPEYYQRIADNGNATMRAPSPWEPMTRPIDLKHLGKLGEELNECGAAVSRCIIQGIDEAESVTGRINRAWLEDEIADVIANARLVIEHFGLDEKRMEERADRKMEHLRTWHGMIG